MHLLTNREDGLTVIAEFFGGPWDRARALGETDAKAPGGVRITDAVGSDEVLDETARKRTYRMDKVIEVGRADDSRLFALFVAKKSRRPAQRPPNTEPFTAGYIPDSDDDEDTPWRNAA